MKTIGENEIWSYCNTAKCVRKISKATQVRRACGHPVRSFLELATKMAELQFMNPDYVLMFRGQKDDYRDLSGNTTLKPSLFRSGPNAKPPDSFELNKRFDELDRAERHLVNEYRPNIKIGVDQLERHRMLRWAILQHYEVCGTPLLDITHSLRIASSFASLNAGNQAFVFVLAIPNISGAITASAEAGLQIVRLSSVCPPTAVRPHLQEGYLLGEYPDMPNYSQKEYYHHSEIDFGRRLLAKFCFNPRKFWKGDTFPQVATEALYPTEEEDPLFKMMKRVKFLAKC